MVSLVSLIISQVLHLGAIVMHTLPVKQVMAQLMACCVLAGLVAGVFLLGYGLVEIPRGLWSQANPEERLRYVCYK